jgi:ankyrin repeat protein
MRTIVLLSCMTCAVSGFSAAVDFERDVKPILRDNCWECHGRTQQNGRLRLDQKQFALLGTGGRADILPGHPETSGVYRRLVGIDRPQMPPETPLSAEQIATIKLWIEQGAQWPDNDGADEREWKPDPRVGPLTDQIQKGNFAAVRAAVTASPELALARDEAGRTLLREAALYSEADDLKWLLVQKADPNAADLDGKTPLMLAVEDLEKVRVLLDAGADPNAHSEAGHTALSLAVEQRLSAPVLKELLAHGAKSTPEKGETDPLVQVARNGDLESMKLLAAQRGDKFPPASLGAAAASNCMPCLQLVLSQAPPKRAVDNAFVGAALMSNLEILNALLSGGADPNSAAADKRAHTALMQAAYSDFAEPARIKLLLDHGADVNAKAKDGETALKLARRKGETGIVKMLIAAGAKE